MQHGKRTSLIANQKGQLAIFVALIFQVLFVFFAMAINIGLTVSDKINLQNSVDLAAYYAAQKQAEVLNAIAHQNYQIRQSWKVLTWRYRVLGSLGRLAHPLRSNVSVADVLYQQAERPPVCITYGDLWEEVDTNENLCHQLNNFIPPLPYIPTIAGFAPGNAQLTALSVQLIAQFNAACERQGAINWWFAMSILTSFRFDQANRKQLINALADNMSNPNSPDFIDIQGGSVAEGTGKVLKKNLTWENFAGTSSLFRWEMLNSLRAVRREQWLPVISISPTILYNDAIQPGGSCSAANKHVSSLPALPGGRAFLFSQLDGQNLSYWTTNELVPSQPLSMSIGVEKNPWIMAYMGVRATSQPRELFWPFGNRVPLQARAFAKPFGGRIGPWHQNAWSPTATQSTGVKTDLLLPTRTQVAGVGNPQTDTTRLPNYSRYPGDTLGYSSRMAHMSLGRIQAVVTGGNSAKLSSYNRIWGAMSLGAPNDPLSWRLNSNVPGKLRPYELAVASPDLFDITYYSIDPHYSALYLQNIRANRGSMLIPSNLPLRDDLGVHPPTVPFFSIQNQMQETSRQLPFAYWVVRNRAHLLTAWSPGKRAVQYHENAEEAVSDGKFGNCSTTDQSYGSKVPGGCPRGGGRMGYSVKLISRSMLNSGDWQVGGVDLSKNTIQNPPSRGGWAIMP